MASLRDIRTRIASVQNTQQVTRAMKMVAAAKLRRAQERIFATRPFSYKLREVIEHLRGEVDPAEHPLFAQREAVSGALVIVVTGDRGLAGPFNANAIKTAEQALRERYADLPRERVQVYALGRKGAEYFAKRGYPMAGQQVGVMDKLTLGIAEEAVRVAVAGFEAGTWDEVVVVYNEFKNTISQNRIVEPLLPVSAERFLTPVMEASDDAPSAPASDVDYLFEPDPSAILTALVPQFLTYQLWRALLESAASENGARMVAMDNATNNSDELLKSLRLSYNQARQAAITTELNEIVSGANALADA